MEHLQKICVSEPKSQPEDLERHLVHSDNHGSSVLDLCVSLKDIDEEYTTNVVTLHQRKEEERGRCLNKGDIEEVQEVSICQRLLAAACSIGQSMWLWTLLLVKWMVSHWGQWCAHC
jgi:hypothetical protein